MIYVIKRKASVMDGDGYLQHHGVKGQKHGNRRYQNPDGSLTPEGREHYGVKNERQLGYKKAVGEYSKAMSKATDLENKSDDLAAEAKKQWKSLGKTRFGRAKEVIKAQQGRGSKAANEYLKKIEQASKLGDKAYDQEMKAKELYKNTGKNAISRFFNNAKYNH